MEELNGVIFFTEAQNKVGPYSKNSVITTLKFLSKEGFVLPYNSGLEALYE